MWCVVINFKDCTLTFNTGFHTKTIDDQVSLNRKLTFGHKNAYLGYIQLSCFEYSVNSQFYGVLADFVAGRSRFSGFYF